MSNNVIYAVDDNGFSAHKLVSYIDGKFVCQKVKTVVGDGQQAYTDISGMLMSTYEVEGSRFICDDRVGNAMDLRNSDYAASKANRALAAHSLKVAGLSKSPVVLGTTLPIRDGFNPDGSVNSKQLEKVKSVFTGLLARDLSDNTEVRTIASRPYVEGLAAFYDWAINDNMELQEYVMHMRGPVLIVDVGGSTTDIATVLAGADGIAIDHGRTGSEQVGVLDSVKVFRAKLNAHIVDKTGENPELSGGLPYWKVELAMETGKINYIQEMDVSHLLEDAKSAVSERIISLIKSKVGDINNYQVVIFVGGGAKFYEEQLKVLAPSADIRDEFTNAKGALKFMYSFDRQKLLPEGFGESAELVAG